MNEPHRRLLGPRRLGLLVRTSAASLAASTAAAQVLNATVFNTGDDVLTADDVRARIVDDAGSAYTSFNIRVINRIEGGTHSYHGTSFSFLSNTADETARVVFRGDLNTGGNERFYGVGSRLLSLNVTGNANCPSASK